MYEQHFGLKKRPFRASATGTDVFVGPHIAASMAGLKNALTSNDAIVTVSGPVGSGKTTLVNRALESIDGNRKTVLVPRMHLNSDDVLELLLGELGVQEIPTGTIQKFALFRRHLKDLAESDTRVFIAIEDSVRLGIDTLAEVEALTAADAGESDGASLVLMGDETLGETLREAPLVRIQQRVRQRLTIAALPVAEIRGYLRHCFRLAGGDFEQIFEAKAADLLHQLSNGIPRVANNLVESAMMAAADQDLDRVSTALLARIAENEYGLSAAGCDIAADTPALIQDTQSALEILPEPAVQANDDVPLWDRDPTIAELRPDLAALEQAMAIAQGDNSEPAVNNSAPLPTPEATTPENSAEIPEITLDHAISQGIESKLIDEPGEISAPKSEKTSVSASGKDIPVLNPSRKKDKQADAGTQKIAADLAKARTIEDVDDKMAETLFGNAINLVASQMLANASSGESANDELEVGPSASQRLEIVRALNVDTNPADPEPAATMEDRPSPTSVPAPDSVEDQITSMPQTLKALDVTPPVIDNDDDESSKGDFFSRFKRS